MPVVVSSSFCNEAGRAGSARSTGERTKGEDGQDGVGESQKRMELKNTCAGF